MTTSDHVISEDERKVIFGSFKRVLSDLDVQLDTYNAISSAKSERTKLEKQKTVTLRSVGELALKILELMKHVLYKPSLPEEDIVIDTWMSLLYKAAINQLISESSS